MKQIIAMGGGGFSMEPDNPLLDQYILDQSGEERPKVCFFPLLAVTRRVISRSFTRPSTS